GARSALAPAHAHPELHERRVPVRGPAGTADAKARAERKQNDEAMAARLEREGLDQFLVAWLAQPLFAGLTDEMQFRHERRENTIVGLAESLRQAGTGSQDPLWARLAQLGMPVLVVAGGDDAKFAAEGARLQQCIGANATLELIPNAGHAAHLEQPPEFIAVLRRWL